MQIAFFVNDIEREYENYTTTVLAHQASTRGHRVCYITPEDFVLNPDDSLSAHGRVLPKRDYNDRAEFFTESRIAMRTNTRDKVFNALTMRNTSPGSRRQLADVQGIIGAAYDEEIGLAEAGRGASERADALRLGVRGLEAFRADYTAGIRGRAADLRLMDTTNPREFADPGKVLSSIDDGIKELKTAIQNLAAN